TGSAGIAGLYAGPWSQPAWGLICNGKVGAREQPLPAALLVVPGRGRILGVALFDARRRPMPHPEQSPGPKAVTPPPPEMARPLEAGAPLATTSLGVQRQMEIYQAGLRGERPRLPLSAEELERRAQEVLPPEAFTYVAGGAGGEDTARANRAAFR